MVEPTLKAWHVWPGSINEKPLVSLLDQGHVLLDPGLGIRDGVTLRCVVHQS
jgi:hypothetical protein